MRPDARVQVAIEVLDAWMMTGQPVERLLSEWGRANRYAGSGDRRAIADRVYAAVRQKRSSAWIAGDETARGIVMGSVLQADDDIASLFTGLRHAPAAVSHQERARIRPLYDAEWGVRWDLPDWLQTHMAELSEGTLEALRLRAPLDLRVNRLKASPDAALAALGDADIQAVPILLVPDGLRVTKGAHRVKQSAAYLGGLVEIQDAASQAAAIFAGAAPGETVLDFCAGGGGKALALAAGMHNQGRVFAHDVSAARLAQMPERAARAGARIELVAPGEVAALAGSCDLVLVDAPCSGSGAWRRNPEAKWTFTPERLDALATLQAQILVDARDCVRPGGRLVYLTCSMLQVENIAQIDAYLGRFAQDRVEDQRTFADLAEGDGFFASLIRVDG
ncbi:MAG: RsmB/NOP family class I SAM-dependent RNA methyltransferase [Pseudomonadota bacterium]